MVIDHYCNKSGLHFTVHMCTMFFPKNCITNYVEIQWDDKRKVFAAEKLYNIYQKAT